MGDAILLIEILVLGILVIGSLAMIMTRGDRDMVEPLAEPLPSLPPVLLPEALEIVARDISDIRFAVVLCGYLTDHVEQVLYYLCVGLQYRHLTISQLQKMVERQQQSTE